VTNAHSSARAKLTPIFRLRTGPHQARHADPRAPIGKKLLSSNKMSKTSLFSVFPGDDRYSLSFAQRKTIFQPASIIFRLWLKTSIQCFSAANRSAPRASVPRRLHHSLRPLRSTPHKTLDEGPRQIGCGTAASSRTRI
jgi:hypothetical protein